MSNDTEKYGYRISYDIEDYKLSGSMDIPLDDLEVALQRFWERIREKFGLESTESYHLEITSIVGTTFKPCKACGQPMCNLGLKFDECVNDKCALYLSAKDQSLSERGI